MADSVFHKDFKSMPWWWEWWHPTNELSQDPPRKTDVLVVGAGYGGLSTALELARSGVEVTVLERGEFGVGASTRNGGGVSGGTTMGKGFSGQGVGGNTESWKKIMERMLADAADSLTQIDTVIGWWARRRRVPFWFPTPSLVQHIGETSTLWAGCDASGPRAASLFVGNRAAASRGAQ